MNSLFQNIPNENLTAHRESSAMSSLNDSSMTNICLWMNEHALCVHTFHNELCSIIAVAMASVEVLWSPNMLKIQQITNQTVAVKCLISLKWFQCYDFTVSITITSMDWSNILSKTPDELTAEVLETIPYHLSSVDANSLSIKELRQFFELNRFVINQLSDGIQRNRQSEKSKSICIQTFFYMILFFHWMIFSKSVIGCSLDLSVNENLQKTSYTDESYYIQTIQEVSNLHQVSLYFIRTNSENTYSFS